MGKGATNQAENTTKAVTQESLDLARGLVKEGEPWRKSAGDFWSNIMSGDSSSVARAAGPQLNLVNRQFNAARTNAQTTMAPGGSRERALSGLNTGQASARSGAIGSAMSDATSRLAALGSGTTQSGIGSYGTAQNSANSLFQIGQAKGNAVGELATGLGSLAATALGSLSAAAI